MALRDLIKQVLRRKHRLVSHREPVYLTDTLIADLDPQYEPMLLSENTTGVLFDPIAIGIKLGDSTLCTNR